MIPIYLLSMLRQHSSHKDDTVQRFGRAAKTVLRPTIGNEHPENSQTIMFAKLGDSQHL